MRFMLVWGLYYYMVLYLDKYIKEPSDEPFIRFFKYERFSIANIGFSILGLRLGMAVQ